MSLSAHVCRPKLIPVVIVQTCLVQFKLSGTVACLIQLVWKLMNKIWCRLKNHTETTFKTWSQSTFKTSLVRSICGAKAKQTNKEIWDNIWFYLSTVSADLELRNSLWLAVMISSCMYVCKMASPKLCNKCVLYQSVLIHAYSSWFVCKRISVNIKQTRNKKLNRTRSEPRNPTLIQKLMSIWHVGDILE